MRKTIYKNICALTVSVIILSAVFIFAVCYLYFDKSYDGESFFEAFIHTAPYLAVIAAAVTAVSLIAAGRITDRIMNPLKAIAEGRVSSGNDVYDELRPVFARIIQDNIEREKTEKIRREFTANVSHELKTPLTAIYGYAQMINNGMVQSQEDMYKFSGKIEKESSRLILLVNDIIKLSHLDENNTESDDNEVLDLDELAQETMSSVEGYAVGKNIKLYYSGESAFINGSRTLISELIYNLLDNAVKYNKEKGSVNMAVGNLVDGVELAVQDTGIGIPDEEQERIFERFYCVDKSHSKTVGGTGLGLSIVKHIAIRYGAEINVKSRVGEGSVITVIFKKADATE